MKLTTGSGIKAGKKEYLVLQFVEEDWKTEVILYDIKEKRIVYPIRELIENENKLWTNTEIDKIIPKEKVRIIM